MPQKSYEIPHRVFERITKWLEKYFEFRFSLKGNELKYLRTAHLKFELDNFLKAVFHKFYLVNSWILCLIYILGISRGIGSTFQNYFHHFWEKSDSVIIASNWMYEIIRKEKQI